MIVKGSVFVFESDCSILCIYSIYFYLIDFGCFCSSWWCANAGHENKECRARWDFVHCKHCWPIRNHISLFALRILRSLSLLHRLYFLHLSRFCFLKKCSSVFRTCYRISCCPLSPCSCAGGWIFSEQLPSLRWYAFGGNLEFLKHGSLYKQVNNCRNANTNHPYFVMIPTSPTKCC